MNLKSGDKFNLLTVLHLDKIQSGHEYYWFKCECGNVKSIRGHSVYSGGTKVCGCLRGKTETHGGFYERLYGIWANMKDRCFNEKHKSFERYGGRGIVVCEDWKNDYSGFRDWSLNNGYKQGLSIDRINNDGNYEPNNCRWATRSQQQMNKSNTRYIDCDGGRISLREFAEKHNINIGTVRQRYYKGIKYQDMLKIKTE